MSVRERGGVAQCVCHGTYVYKIKEQRHGLSLVMGTALLIHHSLNFIVEQCCKFQITLQFSERFMRTINHLKACCVVTVKKTNSMYYFKQKEKGFMSWKDRAGLNY